jgi:fluoroquinolone transport system permease protein
VTATVLWRTQWRVQSRHHIPVLVLGLAVPWTAIAARVPAVGPYLLFVDVAAVGVFIAGALAVSDRTNGVAAALAVSPARPAAITAARLTPLWTVTMAAAVPVLVAAHPGGIAAPLAAVGVTALLLLAAGLGIANRRRTLMGFLTVVPWPLAPLLAVPLAVAAGLLSGPVWYALPTTGALQLIRGTAPYPAGLLLGYLTLWTAAAVGYAIHTTSAEPAEAATPHSRRRRSSASPVSYVRADLRNIRREAIIAPIAASPLLLGLALRFAVPPLTGWADRAHGIDLAAHLPVIALLAIVLHVPVIAGMLGALAVLDDRDDGALHAIRVTPLGTGRYLAYRLALVTGFAAAGLAVAAPLSGQVPASAWLACLLAVPLAPAFTLAVLAVAGNRVDGITAVKALGVPCYAPLAVWWLTGPAGWVCAPLPAFWIVRAWSHPCLAVAASGLFCAGLWLLALTPLALRRLGR